MTEVAKAHIKVGDEEDGLDEDSDAVNDAITQFLFKDKNFYVDKEGDYRGDLGGLDNTLVAGEPKKPECLNMTAKDAVKAMANYQKERRAYTDHVCCQHHKQSEDYYEHSIKYSKCVNDKL